MTRRKASAILDDFVKQAKVAVPKPPKPQGRVLSTVTYFSKNHVQRWRVTTQHGCLVSKTRHDSEAEAVRFVRQYSRAKIAWTESPSDLDRY